MRYDAIDLFAGPGGWDVAAHALGLRVLGVEWDDAACATRRAAGLPTLQADVGSATVAGKVLEVRSARSSRVERLRQGEVVGLIASPPCQAFSMAGTGEGRRAMFLYVEAIAAMAKGEPILRERLEEACKDERAHLVLEPLRWALALRPRWIALEQVKPVLPIWEAMARALKAHGYDCDVGVLSSECYGVPQTRQRAILVARLGTEARLPRATHARYVPPRRADEAPLGLFDLPEPGRVVRPEDRDLLPWVSMAEALGWGMTVRPGVTYAPGTKSGGASSTGGSGARRTLADARERGDWRNVELGQEWSQAHDAARTADEPAPTLTGGGSAAQRQWKLRAGTGDHEAERAADEPAATMRFGERLNTVEWVSNAQENAAVRDLDEPAPTITGGHDHAERVWRQRKSRGEGMVDRADQDPRDRDADEPSFTIDAGSSRCGPRVGWVTDTANTRGGTRTEGRSRALDEPAAAITTRADQLEHRDEPPADRTHYDSRSQRDGRTGEPNRRREVDEPAPTIAGESRNDSWVEDRPATTVAGDPRIFPPGHKINAEDVAAGRGGQQRSGAGWSDGRPSTTVRSNSNEITAPTYTDRDPDWQPGDPEPSQATGAVRVTIEEAATLQSFPADFPWDGLARPPHVAPLGAVEDDETFAHELVGDALERGVHFAVLGLPGEHDEVLHAVVVTDAVDVMHDLTRLRVGHRAVLRLQGAALEHVASRLAGGAGGLAALVRVERITVEPPLLPVAGAEAARDGLAFAVLARWLGWAPVEAVHGVAGSLVVHEAEPSGAVRSLATFDVAEAHGPAPYRLTGSTKTKVFEQIGNAVPPLLARAVLAAVADPPRG